MNLLFLHLTDLHISHDNPFDNSQIDKMKKALNTIDNFDNALIVFTGDISFSGKSQEYLLASNLIGNLCTYLRKRTGKEEYIHVLVVPGNHDIDFCDIPHSRVDIKSRIESNIKDAEEHYLNMMTDFFHFSEKHHCFLANKILDIKYISINGFKLKVNLINSAVFSTYRDKINDYDDGLHQLSNKNLNNLTNKSFKDKDFEITLMHHSPELFTDSSKQIIKEHLENYSNILFYGHEHKNINELSIIDKSINQKILGGPLSEKGKSIFNAVLLNTDTLETINYKFVWNSISDVYDCEKKNESTLESFPKHNSNFINELLTDKLLNEIDDFRQIFVFPELHVIDNISDDNKKIVSDSESFFKKIKDKKYCIIDGYDESGKSSLSKFIYLKLAPNYLPLLFKAENINGTKINKVINFLVKEQYNNKLTFSAFEQSSKELKIAIIDDADKIEKKQFEVVLENIKNTFDKIIIIKGQRTENDIISYFKENVIDDEDSIKFRIELMYSKKREKLLKKLCKFFKPEISNRNLNTFVNKINKMISNEFNIFNLSPSFIILFTKSVLSNNFEFGSAKVFNTVFQSNITKIIQQDCDLDPSITIYLLQKIAFHIHQNKEYPLSNSSFSKIIEDYNNERRKYFAPIKPNVFLQKLINIRILAYADFDGNIKFSYNSYLSFFIAKEILYSKNTESLEKLVDKICFGLNGDILLFLCYLTESNNNEILKLIVNKAVSFFSKYDELNFSDSNIKFLLLKDKSLKLALPTNESIKRKSEKRDREERLAKKSDIIKVQDIYDYDESLINTQQMINLTGIKYIEIISKILPDFIHSIDTKQIDTIIECIYKFPNQHLYCLFKEIDESFVEVLNEIKQSQISEFDYVDEFEELKVLLNRMQRIALLYVLQVYHITIHYATSKNTKVALENFDYKGNINYQLINAFVYDSLGETNKLGSRLSNIFDNSENESIRNLCKIIFFNHCLNNQVQNYGETQGYINKFLGKKITKEKVQKLRAPVKQ